MTQQIKQNVPNADDTGKQHIPGLLEKILDPASVLKYGVSLLIIGGIAEYIHNHVSPFAGYGLVYIVLFAYAVTGDNLTSIQQFIASLGIISK